MSSIRHVTVTVAVIALSLFGLTGVARAQQQLTDDGHHLVRFGAAGGVVVPTSDTRNALRQGVHAQAFVLVNLVQGVPLRFNLGYQKFDLRQALGTTSPCATSCVIPDAGNTSILAGVAGTQIDLLHGPVRPYVTLGFGGFDVRNALSGASSTSVSKLDFGIDGGAGLALKIGRLDAFVEGHLQNVYTERGLVNAKSIQAVPVSFGVLF